ncbi:DUF5776 domain-containing protein [Gemella cuniculi]|uniref:DUF5776 domain-containing protein n=1 Tax=Gemella cuniculi TaxID=150240 RepID=UPI0003F6BD4A|nr:DUF5776 domain-containing protein [Gemella cuniculi]
MTKEEKDKLNDSKLSSPDSKKDINISFFNRLKHQIENLKLKNENKKIVKAEKEALKEADDAKQKLENFDKLKTNTTVQEKEALKQKEKEARFRAFQLEQERKRFEEKQRKIEEEHEKKIKELAERERIERERIAREKELERQRIERERAEKREQERLERERIAREKELERQRIERERAEKREQERLERERIAREKELERQRIERERAEKREQERLERERIAREKELERQRIEREQAEKRRKEFQERDQAFKLAGDKKKVEFLEKENEKKEHENSLLKLETSLIVIDDKIAEQKLLIINLKNQKADKEKLAPHEEKLAEFVSEKQKLQKDISAKKKIIDKIQKNIELEHKIDGIKKEIYNIRKEVVNEDETFFKVKDHDNKVKNIFLVSIFSLKSFIQKNIFRKKVEDYDKIKKTSKNIKVKIATSLILATLLSLCFLVTLKFISSAKEHYVSFDDLQTTSVDSTEQMKKQKEEEEKAKILEAQEKANAARIDSAAQEEEITAKLAGTFVSYSFDVKREVTTTKKIHTFNSANWSDPADAIEAGTKFTVDKLVSPAGYMMYRISSGDHSGQFITANENFVSVDSKSDQFSNYISRAVAIKFLASQNIYTDEAISKVRVTMSSGAVLNINGYGISKNNRLVYHISDGSFVPVNPVRLTEINRESAKSKNIDKEDNNKSNSQKNSTTQNTTQKNKNR